MAFPTFSGFGLNFANPRPMQTRGPTGGTSSALAGRADYARQAQANQTATSGRNEGTPILGDNAMRRDSRLAAQRAARGLLGQLTASPEYVAEMAGYGQGLRSLDLAMQQQAAMSGLDSSSLRRAATLDRQGLGLDREALGIEEGGINFQLGNIPALRGLLERSRTNDIAGIDQSSKMEKIKAESEATAQGGWFRPMLGIERQDIAERARQGREGVQIGHERDTIGLNERERGLQDRLAGVGIDYRRLGLSEQQLNQGLNDALAKLGLDNYFTAADLLGQKAGLTTQQLAYQNSVLQQAAQMMGWL